MSWDSATDKPSITRALLAEITLESETLYVHDGIGYLNWNSHDWAGVGALGAVSGISGGVDLDANDVSLALSGVPSDYRDEIINEVARGKRVNIYQGVLNHAAGTWDFEPELVYAGFIDAPQITEEAPENVAAFLTIVVPVIAASSYVRRLKTWKRTDADQQRIYPGDKFYSFKTDLRNPIPTPGKGGSPVYDAPGGGSLKPIRGGRLDV